MSNVKTRPLAQDHHRLPFATARRYFFALALWGASGLFSVLEGQDLSLTRPGSLNLFHPFPHPDEGNYTAFPLRVLGYAKVGYDDNIFIQHSGAKGSVYHEIGLSADVNVGNETTELTGDLLAGVVSYWQRPGRKTDPDLNLDLSFSRQFNERTVFDLASSSSYLAQPDIAPGVGAPNVLGNHLYTATKISLGFQWTPRIATFTSYSLELLRYDSQSLGSFQDRLDQLFGEEVRYLLRPGIVGVCEFRFGAVHYLYSGIADSYSQYFLGGPDVVLGARLKFGFRAGAELRHIDPPSRNQISYPYTESMLTFLYRPESTIDWYTRYGLEQPDESHSDYRKTFRTGVKISHRISGKTRAIAATYYSHNEYHGSAPFTENLVEANLELTCQITRKLQLSAAYTFTRDFSELVLRDYIRNRIYCWVSYAF